MTLLFFIFLLIGVQISEGKTSFMVLADSPYSDEGFFYIEKELQNLPKETQFIVHLGDIKVGEKICRERDYKDFSDLLARSPIPVFIIPGDNGYQFCENRFEARRYWDRYILEFEKHWDLQFNMYRQEKQTRNFSFFLDGTIFIGIDLFEKGDRDEQKFNKILQNNIFWIQSNLNRYHEKIHNLVIFAHDFSGLRNPDFDYVVCNKPPPDVKKIHAEYKPFRSAFISLIQKFNKPVLYLQGNHHCWHRDHPYPEAGNMERIVFEKIEKAPMVKITVNDDNPENNITINRRIEKRIGFFLKESKLGNVWSQFWLALELLKLKKNEKAKRWLGIAANQNFLPAKIRLGGTLLNEVYEKKEVSYSRILNLLQFASGLDFFENGDFKVPNDSDVTFSYQKRIHRFQREIVKRSQFNRIFFLGSMYFNGKGLEKNYRKALKYFKKAGEGKIGNALYNLGQMYFKGMGVKRNYSEARKWFIKGASQGEKISTYKLGLIYLKGLGVKQDYEEAAKWFMKIQGYAPSSYNLGVMFFKGLGVKRHLPTGLKYFKIAAQKGNPEAQKVLEHFKNNSLD